MDWTEEHDIILLREVLAQDPNFITLLQRNGLDRGAVELAQDPYSYKTGSRERGQVLQTFADVLNNMQQPQFKVTSRSIRDHLNSLLSKFKSKTNKELKASGIEVETTQLNASLEEVLSAKTEYDIKFSKLDDKKKQKTEDDENSGEAVRNRFMERLSETKKRQAVEPQTKRA